MRLVIKKLLVPLRMNTKVVEPTEVAKIFLNIEVIEMISSEILHELEKRVFVSTPQLAQIGEVFCNKATELLQAYSLYCAGHTEALQVIARLCKKKDFVQYLKTLEIDPELRSLALVDWIIKPVQRICKYPLLLAELKKCTPEDHLDYSSICDAHITLSTLVEQVNAN